MEEYRVYSHGRKNVVEVGVGVERDWQQGLMISFFFDIFAFYVELISQSLENLAKTFALFLG